MRDKNYFIISRTKGTRFLLRENISSQGKSKFLYDVFSASKLKFITKGDSVYQFNLDEAKRILKKYYKHRNKLPEWMRHNYVIGRISTWEKVNKKTLMEMK